MVKIMNLLSILDLIILIMGIIILYARPWGVDITYGIMTITAGFLFSIILFLLKLKITSEDE